MCVAATQKSTLGTFRMGLSKQKEKQRIRQPTHRTFDHVIVTKLRRAEHALSAYVITRKLTTMHTVNEVQAAVGDVHRCALGDSDPTEMIRCVVRRPEVVAEDPAVEVVRRPSP